MGLGGVGRSPFQRLLSVLVWLWVIEEVVGLELKGKVFQLKLRNFSRERSINKKQLYLSRKIDIDKIRK